METKTKLASEGPRQDGGRPSSPPQSLACFLLFPPVSQIYFPLSSTKEPGPRLSEFWPDHKLSVFLLAKITFKFYPVKFFVASSLWLSKIWHQKKKLPSVHVSFDNGACKSWEPWKQLLTNLGVNILEDTKRCNHYSEIYTMYNR